MFDIDPQERGPSVALVFSLQGAGQLFAAFCGNVLCQLYASREPYSDTNLDIIWRVLFGIGTLPAIVIFFFRWNAEESTHFEESQRMARMTGFYETLTYWNKMKIAFKYYSKELIGTAGSWFVWFDFFFLLLLCIFYIFSALFVLFFFCAIVFVSFCNLNVCLFDRLIPTQSVLV